MPTFAQMHNKQFFYTPETSGTTCTLTPEESWHCVKVLRMNPGDTIFITDGKGNLLEGKIIAANPKACKIEFIAIREHTKKRSGYLHIAMAPTKNSDRFEWFLEKATEIGIDEVTPVFCEHSERLVLNRARHEKVLISAMKQSLKTHLPQLNEPARFNDFIVRPSSGQKFICYCETGKEAELLQGYRSGSDALILIGPEGDFSGREVNEAISAGFIPVSLGESRLRTETAGVVACHTIYILNRIKNGG